MNCVHMNWPFSKIWLADQKKLVIWLSFFLFRQEFLIGGLFDTRVTFLKKNSIILSSTAKMINANNQPANPIANVGRQQQQVP